MQSSEQPRKQSSKENSEKFKIQKKEGTTGALDGHFYEIDLLILGKLRGDRDVNRFYLATNIDNLGAFDDIVMKYWKNCGKEEKSTTIFLQAKHVENPGKDKITIEKFTNPKKDKFSLRKYFSDYLNSRNRFNDKSKDPVFHGNFQELDLKYIIYTNAILDEKFDKNRITDIDNSIFSTKSKKDKDKAFKFSLDNKNNDVIATLENVSCQERIKLLAKALVSCISGKLNYNSMMGNEFFSIYHVFLAKNVIDVGEKIMEDEKKIKYREGKINYNFLNIDNEDSFKRVLKEEVLYEYAKNVIFNEKSSFLLDDKSELNDLVDKVASLNLQSSEEVDEDVIKKLNRRVIILDAKNKKLKFADQDKIKDESAKKFLKDLRSKVSNIADYKLNIPYNFVKKTLKEQIEENPLKLHVDFGNINPSFKKPKHLIKKLIELFEKYKSQKIIKIDDSVFDRGKMLTNGDVKNIGKLVGNLLVFDEKEKMLRLAGEECLYGCALELIKELKITARQSGLEIIDYRFDIKVKNFPRETLVTDDEDITNVKEFLNKLEVFTGQASDPELKEIIKDEVRDLYKLTKEEVEDSFFKIRNKAEEHWRKGDYYLEKGDDFFANIVKFNIKYDVKRHVTSFIGRIEELRDLHNKIQHGSGGVTVISQIISVSGLGGIGKTELARKYAYDHGNDYDGNVIWINAESYQTLAESFLRLARDKLGINLKDTEGNQKNLKSIVENVYQFFSKRKSLFIFDNAEKNDEFKGFLPLNTSSSSDSKPYVLITSRENKEQWEQWGIKEGIMLDVFTEEDAISFVKERLGRDNSQEEMIRKLAVSTLSRFPLALQQAVAHIRNENKKYEQRGKGKYTIDSYLKEYEEKKKELLHSNSFQSLDNDYAKTTFTTWKITIEKIRDNEKYGKLALNVLDVIAYCASNNVPVKNFLSKLEKDDDKLWEAVELLNKYSIIKLEQGKLDVHRLVQEVTRINLKDREKEILTKTLKLFELGGSEIDLFNNYFCLNNVDHAISVWKYANNHEKLVTEFSRLPALIVSELNATLRYQEAYLFGSSTLKLLEKILGDNHLSVLLMMNSIAFVLYRQGKDDDALKIYRKLNEKSDIITKLMPKFMLPFDNMIGLILNRQGKHDEALEIFLRSHSLVEKEIFFSDGSIQHNLGVVFLAQHKFDEAMKMFEVALTQKKEILGSNHESTLNTENSISTVLSHQHKYEESLKMSWEIYKKRKEILGPNHPDTLTTYGNIAMALTDLEKYDEALKIANEVEKEREKLLPDHPRTLKGKETIATILHLQGKYEKAIEKFKEVYEKRKNILGPNHPDTLTTLDNWYSSAVRLAKRCNYDKALQELHNVLTERKKLWKPNDPSILQVEHAISAVHKVQQTGADFKLVFIDRKLFHAVQEGQLDIVNDLLNKDVAIDIQTSDEGWTPLQIAVHKGHERIVDALLKNGADVNLEDFANWTALHYAAQRGHLRIANALLKKGANVNKINNQGETPLQLASGNGHKNIVETLLKVKGINVNVKVYNGVTRLHCAAQNDNAEIIKLLLNDANIEATDINGWTPLHDAAYNNSLNAVTVLLGGGANIEATSQDNKKPIDYTTNNSIKKVLELTQELFNAVRIKQNEFKIQQLLRSGASVNAVSGTDRLTVLHFAVSNGNVAVIKALLEKRPKIDAVDEDGWTPLHYAVQDGYSKVVKLLLAEGADRTIKNKDGKTLLDLAREKLGQNPQTYQGIIAILKST